jgi:hypothetical protein
MARVFIKYGILSSAGFYQLQNTVTSVDLVAKSGYVFYQIQHRSPGMPSAVGMPGERMATFRGG